jgi:hypothetical protein
MRVFEVTIAAADRTNRSFTRLFDGFVLQASLQMETGTAAVGD